MALAVVLTAGAAVWAWRAGVRGVAMFARLGVTPLLLVVVVGVAVSEGARVLRGTPSKPPPKWQRSSLADC